MDTETVSEAGTVKCSTCKGDGKVIWEAEGADGATAGAQLGPCPECRGSGGVSASRPAKVQEGGTPSHTMLSPLRLTFGARGAFGAASPFNVGDLLRRARASLLYSLDAVISLKETRLESADDLTSSVFDSLAKLSACGIADAKWATLHIEAREYLLASRPNGCYETKGLRPAPWSCASDAAVKCVRDAAQALSPMYRVLEYIGEAADLAGWDGVGEMPMFGFAHAWLDGCDKAVIERWPRRPLSVHLSVFCATDSDGDPAPHDAWTRYWLPKLREARRLSEMPEFKTFAVKAAAEWGDLLKRGSFSISPIEPLFAREPGEIDEIRRPRAEAEWEYARAVASESRGELPPRLAEPLTQPPFLTPGSHASTPKRRRGGDKQRERNEWIASRRAAGAPFPKILKELHKLYRKSNWTKISTVPGVEKAYKDFCEDNKLRCEIPESTE